MGGGDGHEMAKTPVPQSSGAYGHLANDETVDHDRLRGSETAFRESKSASASLAALSSDFGGPTFAPTLMRKVAIEGEARQIASIAEDSANSRCSFVLWEFESEMVGATGFEPATPCAQGRFSALFTRFQEVP